jgi:hypothetical protein
MSLISVTFGISVIFGFSVTFGFCRLPEDARRIIHNGFVFHRAGQLPASVGGGREAADRFE